ncbi:UNVERIFIED_CONTAM: hypothetical protein NCL1_09689 [Trichonephila clavipes]
MEDVEIDEDIEEKLFDLQNNIQHIERKMRITESEKKADAEESNSKIKKNELEIKRLKMEIKELQVRIERYQKRNKNLMNMYNSTSLNCLFESIGTLEQREKNSIMSIKLSPPSVLNGAASESLMCSGKFKFGQFFNRPCRILLQYDHLRKDENIVAKEFQKHSRELGNFKGKSAKEAVQMLEAEALDLQRKSKSLNHELDLRNRTLQHNEEQYKDMISNCEADFENEPTEYHSIQVTNFIFSIVT